MVSRKRYIVTVITAILITAVLTISLGNVLLVETGQKVVLSKETYNQMKDRYEKYAKQESLMEIAKQDFLYEADENKMLEGALEGTLRSLGDPYTQFMTKEEFG